MLYLLLFHSLPPPRAPLIPPHHLRVRSTLGVAPAATFAAATIIYAEELNSDGVVIAAFVLALASTLLVLAISVMTVVAVAKGKVFAPDPVLSVVLEGSTSPAAIV